MDDTRANRSITDIALDCQALQDDLAGIYAWAEDVNMVFNSDKFECLRFWPGKTSKSELKYKSPDGTIIEEKANLQDLGVQISSDLSFSIHIQNTATAALRTFRRMTIWKSLIQSKVDYCSQLWSPTDQSSISKLESIARHFTAKDMDT